MKARIAKSIFFVTLIFIFSSVSAQESSKQSQMKSCGHKAHCEYEAHKEVLNAYRDQKLIDTQSRLRERSGSPNMDIRIYIDTSYERRRTGGYNNNDSVVEYLNGIVNEVQNAFNLAAQDWDIIVEPEYVFFDGVTPFSYGTTAAQTLINFYEWVDMQGYPGNRDTYVFYSGFYTNQGVAFLGSLCLPGGAMVGFVQNQESNEDLSSHEWIGHCADSPHFDSEVNIMNSVAHRPWNQPSIDIIEDYLENQSCVINVQGSLS